MHNGDFETGHLGAWQCTGCHCTVLLGQNGGFVANNYHSQSQLLDKSFHGVTSRHHLEVRDRQTEFSGPWQLVHPLPDSSQLQLTLNFSIAARWVRVTSCLIHCIAARNRLQNGKSGSLLEKRSRIFCSARMLLSQVGDN